MALVCFRCDAVTLPLDLRNTRIGKGVFPVVRARYNVGRKHDATDSMDNVMERNFTARGHHDMGGLDAGPIDREEHDYALWEKRVDAMMMLLTNRLQIMTVDQLRKGIEALPPDAYDKMTYYERWIASLTNTLLDSGVISAAELGAKMAEVEARATASEAAQ